MEEKLYEFISATFGISAAVAFAIIMLALWLTYFITAKVTAIKSDHNTLAKSVEKLEKNSDEIRQDLAFLKGNIDCIKETMQSNNGILVELSRWAMHMDESMIDKLAQKHSPLRMTETGEYLYEVSGAKKAVGEIADRLISEMETMGLRTELDVEDKSLDMIIKNNNDSAFDPVKKYVYYSPDTIKVEKTGETVRFNMFSLMKLMGIDLRDRYLAKHPEICGMEDIMADPNVPQ